MDLLFLQLPLRRARGKLCPVPAPPGQLVPRTPGAAGKGSPAIPSWGPSSWPQPPGMTAGLPAPPEPQVSSPHEGRANFPPCAIAAQPRGLSHGTCSSSGKQRLPGVYHPFPVGCAELASPSSSSSSPGVRCAASAGLLAATSPCPCQAWRTAAGSPPHPGQEPDGSFPCGSSRWYLSTQSCTPPTEIYCGDASVSLCHLVLTRCPGTCSSHASWDILQNARFWGFWLAVANFLPSQRSTSRLLPGCPRMCFAVVSAVELLL